MKLLERPERRRDDKGGTMNGSRAILQVFANWNFGPTEFLGYL